jgi:hypothetical protein
MLCPILRFASALSACICFSQAAFALRTPELVGSYDGAYSNTCFDRGMALMTVTMEGTPLRATIAMAGSRFTTAVVVRNDKVFMDIDFARREWVSEPTLGKLRLTTSYDVYIQRFKRTCSVTIWLDKAS